MIDKFELTRILGTIHFKLSDDAQIVINIRQLISFQSNLMLSILVQVIVKIVHMYRCLFSFSGIYELTPKSCYKFEKETYLYDT